MRSDDDPKLTNDDPKLTQGDDPKLTQGDDPKLTQGDDPKLTQGDLTQNDIDILINGGKFPVGEELKQILEKVKNISYTKNVKEGYKSVTIQKKIDINDIVLLSVNYSNKKLKEPDKTYLKAIYDALVGQVTANVKPPDETLQTYADGWKDNPVTQNRPFDHYKGTLGQNATNIKFNDISLDAFNTTTVKKINEKIDSILSDLDRNTIDLSKIPENYGYSSVVILSSELPTKLKSNVLYLQKISKDGKDVIKATTLVTKQLTPDGKATTLEKVTKQLTPDQVEAVKALKILRDGSQDQADEIDGSQDQALVKQITSACGYTHKGNQASG